MVKITITMTDVALERLEKSRLQTVSRTGKISNRSEYIRWLLYHGLRNADKLNFKVKS